MTVIGVPSIRRPGQATVLVASHEGLPPNVIEAYRAIEAGQLDRARVLMDDRTRDAVHGTLEQDPSRIDGMHMLAWIWARLGDPHQAESWYRKILKQGPNALALYQLAWLCSQTGRISQAVDLRSQALALDQDNVEIWIAYGMDLLREGRLDNGIAWLRKAVEREPWNADAHSKLLFHMHYLLNQDPKALFEEHQRWGRIHAPLGRARVFHENDPDPHRRLRIGYVSADFRRNSVAYTFDAILNGRDTKAVEVYGYGSVASPDEVTERLEGKFDRYRSVYGLSDEAVAHLVEQDKIDILVAIAGHVGGHRLGVLAYKPAPIQVDLQGIDTTGIGQVDYRVTDDVIDPPESQAYYTERFEVLQRGILCYTPSAAMPPVGPGPVERNGYITFGSFNSFLKTNRFATGLWAQVLLGHPRSRLLLKFDGGYDRRIKQDVLGRFAGYGIGPDRIRLLGSQALEDHWHLYNEVDIALDTYPFNGCMTTLEGLWMGVPAISLVGHRFISRAGLAILSVVGLDACTAVTPQEFVAKALALAGNCRALALIRANLRKRMAASPLCDAQAYARALEGAYRRMWRRWCEKQITNQKSQIKNEESIIHHPSSIPVSSDGMDFFLSDRSDLRFTVHEKGVPSFLFEAVAAIRAGDADRAKALLSDTAVESIHLMDPRDPARIDAMFLLGMLWGRTGQSAKAEPCYQEVVIAQPHALVYFELGNLCRDQGRLGQALDYQRKAVDLSPQTPGLQAVLGEYLIKIGRCQEGIEVLRRSVARSPDRLTGSKVLWHLHQTEELDQAALFQEHSHWGRVHAPMSLARTRHDRDTHADRRLRIGYVSPDFCGHSVAYFFESLLDGHDRDGFEVSGYGNVPCQDVVTERLTAKFDRYRNIRGLEDSDVVDLIEEDRIDILVDLAGHTGDNRLGVLACKPAPIQVSYLGYPDTTGMGQVDYRFTDHWADLAQAGRFYTEQLVSLPSGFICYRPPGFAPDVGPLPAERNGFVTYGSFNNNGKINARVLELWALILKAEPTARLLLKFNGGDDPTVRQSYTDAMAHHGIARERLTILGRRPVLEHFDLYNQVDIALDTYPYHGTTTTCEALWMGVPTVTLVGRHHASRVGLSLLSRVGLEIFAGETPDEYMTKAVLFGRERENLALIRRSLRRMMLSGPLCDFKAYARDVEAAYRHMWRQWCDKQSQNPKSKIQNEESILDSRSSIQPGG